MTQSNHGFTVSEIYTWDVGDKSIETIQPPLYPPVYITNAAFAHSITYDNHKYMGTISNSPLVKFWREYNKIHIPHNNNQQLQHSQHNQQQQHHHHRKGILKIYQSSSAMHGKRNSGFQWMNEPFRRQNEINRKIFIEELKFLDFDEWILTAAKPDFIDGWHYYSVPLKMNAMILLNLMCQS